MIFILDDEIWKEYKEALRALDRKDVQSPYSSYQTSMGRVRELERLVRAKTAVLNALRVPKNADRKLLFEMCDALRARPETKGPKPSIKDPLTER